MPLICGLDLETTGLDAETCHITELGYIVKQTYTKKPMIMVSQLCYDETTYGKEPVPTEITELTGITNDLLLGWGEPIGSVLSHFLTVTREVDFFVAHNGHNFDRPFLLRKLKEYLPDADQTHPVFNPAKWLDSQADIEHKGRSNSLSYVAADMGFLNPFPHSALFDVATMLKIVERFDFAAIVERAKIPWVVVQAHVSYDNRELAKARRYRWEEPGNGKKYQKSWVKMLKADKVDAEAELPGFKVSVLEAV